MKFPCLPLISGVALCAIAAPVWAAQPLSVAYPPPNHQTTANQIFLIGTAPSQGTVLVNGKPISRSPAGHFAPSFPLKPGNNVFNLQYGTQELKLTVTRLSASEPLTGATFAPDSLTPAVDVARLPGESICFGAIAPSKATVSVTLANQTFPLQEQMQQELPENAALLTQQNQPVTAVAGQYKGCVQTALLGDLGKPEFRINLDGKSNSQMGAGAIKILSPIQLEVVEVTAEAGTARTGPSTDYSRLTPLPKGTQAVINGYEGDWVRLDYGAWIRRSEVEIRRNTAPPTSIIRSIKARQTDDWTEVVFPLQVPVPVSVQQGDRTFTLTLHNTTAQTDIIRLDDDPLIDRLDWQQTVPGQVQYTFNLKSRQQWGYRLRYEGSSLILALKHPPKITQPPSSRAKANPFSLKGIKILLDPGHGGPEDLGARGPTGYPEKDITLIMAKLVREQLQQRGATVYLTREKDEDVPLQNRVALIDKTQPTMAISLHYNALPDNGDALKTQGVSTFWYNTQAHSLAMFMHNYLVKTLKRPSYGVFWDNLALTRPTVTPSVLLEIGFMINPVEFEWITNSIEQKKLATAIANGISEWIRASQPSQENQT